MSRSKAQADESSTEQAVDFLPISIRTYVEPEPGRKTANGPPRKRLEPSEYALVFDTETSTDAAQTIRFGAYQERKDGDLIEAGVFYHPEALTTDEQALMRAYALNRDLKVLTLDEFIEEVLYGFGYDLRGTIVGFNLPFDLSRLAKSHGPARRKMRGGFSLRVSEDRYKPRIQVKHLSGRAALIQFAAPARQHTARSGRQRGRRVPVRRGHFVDVKTLGAALLSQSHSLASLARFLGTSHQKLDADAHGRGLTEGYLDYAVNDVQTTWECFEALSRRYEQHGLNLTPVHSIYSEASIGKAYLKQMRIRPWREVQPEFSGQLVDTILRTYYGGRAEVHLRRVVSQVLYCDFRSMYPTVCTLMGLWNFVVATGVEWRDDTESARQLLARVSLGDLQQQSFWPQLGVLVQIAPDSDLLPVRAQYGGDPQKTIGVNYLTSTTPLWYTLADCIASKLLTGRTPAVLRAVRFVSKRVQAGLSSVAIARNPNYRVDPLRDDFFRKLIDLRTEIRKEEQSSSGAAAAALNSAQLALKILANATSYGIYVELNVEDLAHPEPWRRFDGEGNPSQVQLAKVERPGTYFHPLLGTLITGAARLMLAITERLVLDSGLDWALCDTDSMAIARPHNVEEPEFLERAQSVVDWFHPLNPYVEKGSLLRIEDANYGFGRGRTHEDLKPLYCLAISAKRYALFNLDREGLPVIRKASAHGLGHLLAPYEEEDAPRSIPTPTIGLKEIGVERWQCDLWYRIIDAFIQGRPNQPDLADIPGLDRPAASRYGATTPAMLRWFDGYNCGKPYWEQVKPFNFLLAFQEHPLSEPASSDGEPVSLTRQPGSRKRRKPLRPIAPFDTNPAKASRNCIDRETGTDVCPEQLKTYREALAQYHLHPEMKFLDADYMDRGPTRRRHIHVAAVYLIGKEADRLEEQFYLGLDPEAEVSYGIDRRDKAPFLERLSRAVQVHGIHETAMEAGISRQQLSAIVSRKAKASDRTMGRLARSAARLDAAKLPQDAGASAIVEQARRRCEEIGLRGLAEAAAIDAGNLSRILNGRRKMNAATASKIALALRL